MMFKRMTRNAALLLVGCGVMSAPTYAAQLEEIIVTAQKRQESQQDVPISIQTLTGESLENLGITNSDDLGFVTPGLQMTQGGIGNIIFLRGMGNQDATGGQEGSVGVYVDGLWYGSATGSALTLNSIERLEVLKGPQGTLFGRNTTGGVINVITKEPSAEPSGNLTLSYGNYERARASFYGTRGITENIAADISLVWSDQGEGFGTNLATGKDVNKREDEVYLRTKWKYSGETTDVTFAYSYEEFDDDLGYVRSLPKGPARDLAGLAAPNDSRDINSDTEGWADFENTSISLRIDKEFDSFDFMSITGYKDDMNRGFTDNDYSSAFVLNAAIDFYSEAFTQEFQFSSNDLDASIRWIAGLFYLDSDGGSDITISGPAIQFTPTGGFTGLNDLRFFGDISTRSYAAFGEVEFDLTDTQSLTVGLRYTKDEREVDGGDQFTLINGAPGPIFTGTVLPVIPTPHQEADFDEPTYRIVYDNKVTDNVLLYASYNRGFRSGNFNAVSPAGPAFNPEFVDAYEIGIKSDLLDGQLRLNAALYHYDVEDLQFQVLQGITATTINAAGAKIDGAEIDLTWLASDNLMVVAGVSIIDSEYEGFTNAVTYPLSPVAGSIGLVEVDASGNQLTKTPKFEATLGLSYHKETDSGNYRSDLNINYNDGYPWDADGRLQQESYTMVNFSLGWKTPSESWGIQLLVNNLLDEDYAVHQAQSAFGDFYSSGKPRTYTLSASYNF